MATLQRLAPADLARKLTLKPQRKPGHSPVFRLKILRYKRLPSTNTTAYELGEKGSAEWTVVIADQQTRGRGRTGKKWESPKGGLWFSVLLRPDVPLGRLPVLQYLAANASRQALEDETGLHVQLKWPNDLMIGTAKLGGILTESKSVRDRVLFTVIGIGLNVNQSASELPAGATSALQATGLRYNREKLLRAILDQMISKYLDIDEPAVIVREWWRNCVHRPPIVQVALDKDTITGISRGMDENGTLTIETEDRRLVRVSEGTLRVVP